MKRRSSWCRVVWAAFAADPQIKLLLVESALAARDFRLGQQTIEHLRAVHPTFKPAEVLLLKARLHESSGEVEPALSTYAEALPHGIGEEVRVRYAQLLARDGRVDMARELFETTVKNAERFGSGYRDLHRDWIAAAKRDLGAFRA